MQQLLICFKSFDLAVISGHADGVAPWTETSEFWSVCPQLFSLTVGVSAATQIEFLDLLAEGTIKCRGGNGRTKACTGTSPGGDFSFDLHVVLDFAKWSLYLVHESL